MKCLNQCIPDLDDRFRKLWFLSQDDTVVPPGLVQFFNILKTSVSNQINQTQTLNNLKRLMNLHVSMFQKGQHVKSPDRWKKWLIFILNLRFITVNRGQPALKSMRMCSFPVQFSQPWPNWSGGNQVVLQIIFWTSY